jgi:hypothetical protein
MMNALLLQGVPDCMRVILIGGANVNDRVEVREYSDVRDLELTAGAEDFVPGFDQIERAARLARRLAKIRAAGGGLAPRLFRGVRTLLRANGESNRSGDRLHQFVRALEAVIKPRIGASRADFATRGGTFLVSRRGTRQALEELYDLRSVVEHQNPLLSALEGDEEQRIVVADWRTRQIDALARFVLCRIMEDDGLFDIFSADEKIDAFWRLPPPERQRRWGARLDIEAID